VRTDHGDMIRWWGAFPPGESFDAWSPDAPFVVATLDDRGLHFSPDEIAGGLYNVCFVDSRTHRTHADEVVLDFCFCAGPLLTTLSVAAGTIGSGMLCPITAQVDVSIDDRPAQLPASPTGLSIEPRPGCPTGWT
jgi:hypothetical protein